MENDAHVVFRRCGHVSMDPRLVAPQFFDLVKAPISPPPEIKLSLLTLAAALLKI